MKLRRSWLLYIAVLLSFVWHPVALAQKEKDPIKIGAVLILTGTEAMFGDAFREGIEIALNMRKNGVGREKTKEALYTIKDYQGASGNISFNSKGSSPTFENMFQIRDGKFVFVE